MVFMLHQKMAKEEESPIEVSYTHELQWVLTARPITRPQLLDVVHSAIGIEQLVYLYAKVCLNVC